MIAIQMLIQFKKNVVKFLERKINLLKYNFYFIKAYYS